MGIRLTLPYTTIDQAGIDAIRAEVYVLEPLGGVAVLTVKIGRLGEDQSVR